MGQKMSDIAVTCRKSVVNCCDVFLTIQSDIVFFFMSLLFFCFPIFLFLPLLQVPRIWRVPRREKNPCFFGGFSLLSFHGDCRDMSQSSSLCEPAEARQWAFLLPRYPVGKLAGILRDSFGSAVFPLGITAFRGSEGYISLWSIRVHRPQTLLSLGKMEMKESRLLNLRWLRWWHVFRTKLTGQSFREEQTRPFLNNAFSWVTPAIFVVFVVFGGLRSQTLVFSG